MFYMVMLITLLFTTHQLDMQNLKRYGIIDTHTEVYVKDTGNHLGKHWTRIEHDGGTHTVDVELDNDLGTALISFGASFSLRLDEKNIDKLRSLLFDASRDLSVARSVREDAEDATDEELEAAQELLRSWADEINDYKRELDQSEQVKRMAKGTSSTIGWDPDDPVNW